MTDTLAVSFLAIERETLDRIFELLPWLVPVLIGVVAGLAKLMKKLVEMRQERERRARSESFSERRRRRLDDTEVPPATPRREPSKPRRSIVDEIRRYLERIEESAGEIRPAEAPVGKPDETREDRMPAEPAVPSRSEERAERGRRPRDVGIPVAAPVRTERRLPARDDAGRPSPVRVPVSRPRLEPRVAAIEALLGPSEAPLARRPRGRRPESAVLRSRDLSRPSLRKAIALAELLGTPVGLRDPETRLPSW
jgi:hypothetical protein